MLTMLLLVTAQASYGLTNCLWKVKGRTLSSWWLMANRSLITFPVFLLILYFAGSGKPWTDYQWLTALWSLPLSLVGLVLFIRGVRIGSVSRGVPTLAFISFWGVLSSTLFFNQSLQSAFLLPAILLVIGFFVVNLKEIKHIELDKGTWMIMLSAFCWGVTIPAFAEMSKGDALWKLSAIQECMVLLVSAVSYWFRPVADLRVNKGLGLPILIGFLTVVGVGGTNYVLGQISPVVFSMLCLTQPAVSLLVAYLNLGERLSSTQWVGVVLLLSGSAWLMSV
jgi:drug/metabolite transporter (DMT)-like permease